MEGWWNLLIVIFNSKLSYFNNLLVFWLLMHNYFAIWMIGHHFDNLLPIHSVEKLTIDRTLYINTGTICIMNDIYGVCNRVWYSCKLMHVLHMNSDKKIWLVHVKHMFDISWKRIFIKIGWSIVINIRKILLYMGRELKIALVGGN